jgi:hypothetical protein
VENDDSNPVQNKRGARVTLCHYTDAVGLRGILESRVLLPSLRDVNPRDARYGDGQYLSDVRPGSMPPSRLSRCLVGLPWQWRRFTHYVEVDVAGLDLVLCRSNVYLIPGREPLPLEGRTVCWGTNEWSGT